MQWILQDYEDTNKLSAILDRAGVNYSMHKVIPFIGQLQPIPEIIDPSKVIMFGSYSLRHYAREHNLSPGVFEIRPFLYEDVWKPYLLNNTDLVFQLKNPTNLLADDLYYFVRPVEDSKEIAGAVMSGKEIYEMVSNVNKLKPDEYIKGSLNPDTYLMISKVANIQKEWRIWVIDNKIVTYSLYKLGSRVIYQHDIDFDAYEFAISMIHKNRAYSRTYVLDVCKTDMGMKILETNCINAAGFYEADLFKIVEAFENYES